ncbi:MAG TPA: zeta toxin family protein [Candidatus Xenobia bacterium]|jgi:predicted kinase
MKVASRAPGFNWPATLFDQEDRPGAPVPDKFTSSEVEAWYTGDSPSGLTPPGQELVKEVAHEVVQGKPDHGLGDPVLILTGGVPGSGKSTVMAHLKATHPDLVVIDPDHVKERVVEDLAKANPELVAAMRSNPDWGSVVHETSKVMARNLLGEVLKSGHDVVLDSSMGVSDPDRFRDYVKEACRHGYDVHAIVLYKVDPEVAQRRNSRRGDAGTEIAMRNGETLALPGRRVPDDLIHLTHDLLHQNVEAYVNEGLFRRITLLDNNTDGQPAHVLADYEQTAGHGTWTSRPYQKAWGEQLPLLADMPPSPAIIPGLD